MNNNGSISELLYKELLPINISVYKKQFVFSKKKYYLKLVINDKVYTSDENDDINTNKLHSTMNFFAKDEMNNTILVEIPINFNANEMIAYIDNRNSRIEYVSIKNPSDDAEKLAQEFYNKYRK